MSFNHRKETRILVRQSGSALALACAVLMLGSNAACKSSSKSGSGNDAGPSSSNGTGGSSSAGTCGAVKGEADMHCTDSSGEAIKQATSQSSCKVGADASIPSDDGGVEEEAPILYGSEGDDDDCKYHLKWTVTCPGENKDVTFKVTVTNRSDGKPATKAAPDLEVYLSDTHLAPDTKQKPTETAPGVYTAGPIRFDAPGRWTVRFHLYETCVDLLPDSPHGHAAFYVDVP